MLAQLLARRNRRYLWFLCLLSVLLVVCVIEMVRSLTVTHSTPAYADQPAPAFATPSSVSIVNAQLLVQPRLPDDDYRALGQATLQLAEQAGQGTLTAQKLRSLGLDQSDAQMAVAASKTVSEQFAGRQLLPGGPPALSSVSPTGQSAEFSVEIDYGPSASQAAQAASAQATFISQGAGRWTLQAFSFTLDSAAPPASSTPDQNFGNPSGGGGGS